MRITVGIPVSIKPGNSAGIPTHVGWPIAAAVAAAIVVVAEFWFGQGGMVGYCLGRNDRDRLRQACILSL